MHISINIPSAKEAPDLNRSFFPKIKSTICRTPIKRCFLVLIVLVTISLVIFLCKTYITSILIWIEGQDRVIINIALLMLFIVVSFPICVGYVMIVIATGYLYNFTLGLITTITCANCGILIAHNVLKYIGHHSSFSAFLESKTALALTKLISGPHSFKIVACTRLTPIPFGLQNTIFAFGNVPGEIYHIASFLGLIPGQVVGVYIGSSVRSMQDVLDNEHDSFTYSIAVIQLILGGALLIWLGSKARAELTRAIAEADTSTSKSDKVSFNIV